jgi:hypothetical protein
MFGLNYLQTSQARAKHPRQVLLRVPHRTIAKVQQQQHTILPSIRLQQLENIEDKVWLGLGVS